MTPFLGAKPGRSLDDAQIALGMLATARGAIENFTATISDLLPANQATGGPVVAGRVQAPVENRPISGGSEPGPMSRPVSA